ncbi:MAG: EAL domain-containing protein [Butyrivibrio sp.]|nr:EAL domain-containing protein [Butyrivibrio sp.]
MLFLSVFLATLFERIETHLQMNPVEAPWYHYAEMFSGSAYFLCHLGSGLCYLLYIMAVLDIFFDAKSYKGFFAIFFGYIIGFLMVFANWFTSIMFGYGDDGIYYRGSHITVFYVVAFYYVLCGVVLTFKYSNFMRLKTRIIVLTHVGLTILGIYIQYKYPLILIENFLITIGITLVFITLQNPNEMVDGKNNVLNRRAFFETVGLKIKKNARHQLVFVTIDNVRALTSEIGNSQAEGVIKTIAKYLKKVGRKELKVITYVYRYSDNIFAIAVNTIDPKVSEDLMYKISYRIREPWNYADMTIKVEGHCFMMSYPEQYKDLSELMLKIELVTDDIAQKADVVVDTKNSNFDEKLGTYDYEVLARKNIEEKKAVVKFRPVVSKIYKINYTAEAVCYIYDDAGKEIEVRRYIEDSRATQTIMDIDEYVLKNTLRALSFWNAGDKNGKFRAIIPMSQAEVSRNDFTRRLKALLKEENVDGSWISLKLAETAITTMNSVAERNLKKLKDMNVSVIVDNYGSGYGNIERIISLPVMQINFAQSLLRAAQGSIRMMNVVSGLVNMFHDISFFVCASGVDTLEDKDVAEELGCDYLIGNYMGYPVKDSSYVKKIDEYFERG